MNYELLSKVRLLALVKQKEVENFIENLLKEQSKSESDIYSIAEKRRANLGRLKRQIWMSGDFNEYK
jgi:hypothetical protein